MARAAASGRGPCSAGRCQVVQGRVDLLLGGPEAEHGLQGRTARCSRDGHQHAAWPRCGPGSAGSRTISESSSKTVLAPIWVRIARPPPSAGPASGLRIRAQRRRVVEDAVHLRQEADEGVASSGSAPCRAPTKWAKRRLSGNRSASSRKAWNPEPVARHSRRARYCQELQQAQDIGGIERLGFPGKRDHLLFGGPVGRLERLEAVGRVHRWGDPGLPRRRHRA